ncbi:hypothetical protein HA402_012574 [Bradysia odoriphaga]|nr:hypothetical protein HA402_012574 [Bradysia odoriphaga]
MRGSKLHSAFVRRREIEQIKIDKSAAVDKYFDKWGKITSRFEQWTAPEFYKQADEVNKQRELDKIKNESLESRREKLKKLLDDEKVEQEMCLKELSRPRSKQLSSSMLTNIHETMKRTEEEKRRLDLESRLYKKWRNGFCQDSILLDSKSDHEALAKMNWLDKQVADQVERDQEKRESEIRQLRLQEEARKHEECLMQRRNKRDDEISDLKSFQNKHISEIKARQKESDDLRCNELKLIQRKEDIASEFEKLNSVSRQRKDRISCPFNLRRIKMILRQRSDSIRQDLKDDIDMLNRISFGYENEQIGLLKEKFELHYDMEIQKQTQIEAMYESEAKHSLAQQEELWNQEADGREKLLKKLISEQLKNIDDEIEYNIKRQRELIEIKEQHLAAIENCSMRLKELLNEQSRDESRSSSRLSLNDVAPTSNDVVREKFDNLQISAPKFGRKKVAWT